MRFTSATAAASLLTAAAAFTPATTAGTDKLAAEGLNNLAHYEAKDHPPQQCNTTSGYVRREWDTLSTEEKTEYISAVLCLQSKPSISGSIAPGAKSRYDDFVATHINQTLTIHGTGNFLSWHRYFTWTYEHALRNECGYTGYQPYFNWPKYSLDLLNAPVFDGSATSISGNGAYREEPGVGIPSNAEPEILLPHGVGAGCVTAGPFANMSVNLGPVAAAYADEPTNPSPDGLGYNPRCLRRDLSTYAAETNLQDANVTDLITQKTNVYDFQNTMQGNFSAGIQGLGVHTAGHFVVGGDPGGDLFTSPGDPYFFLHHAQVDRVWWIWQNQDLANRQYQIAGTITLDNSPPSRNTTLQDIIELGVNAPGITIESAMSTLAGEFCYIYV